MSYFPTHIEYILIILMPQDPLCPLSAIFFPSGTTSTWFFSLLATGWMSLISVVYMRIGGIQTPLPIPNGMLLCTTFCTSYSGANNSDESVEQSSHTSHTMSPHSFPFSSSISSSPSFWMFSEIERGHIDVSFKVESTRNIHLSSVLSQL